MAPHATQTAPLGSSLPSTDSQRGHHGLGGESRVPPSPTPVTMPANFLSQPPVQEPIRQTHLPGLRTGKVASYKEPIQVPISASPFFLSFVPLLHLLKGGLQAQSECTLLWENVESLARIFPRCPGESSRQREHGLFFSLSSDEIDSQSTLLSLLGKHCPGVPPSSASLFPAAANCKIDPASLASGLAPQHCCPPINVLLTVFGDGTRLW